MILTKTIDIKLNRGNISYFKTIKDDIKIDDILTLNIEQLPKNSRYMISVKCTQCGDIKDVRYCDYNRYTKNKINYTCKKCSLKINNLKKYGVDNVFQLDGIKEKIKKTLKEKYGVENISQSQYIKDKKIETNLKKYKSNYPLSNEKIREKIKKTLKEKYGVENISQSQCAKNKKIETSIKNYGCEYPSQSDIFKDNIKKTNLKKYGVEWNLLNGDIKEKIKNTNIKIYGYDNPSKSDIIKNKIKKSNILTSHKKIFNENRDIIDIIDDKYIIKCDCKGDHNFEINRVLFYKRRENNTIICTLCNPINKHQSGLEMQLFNYIKDHYSGKIITSDRKIIKPYELDIYLPDLGLAFEFNGLYWHNELNKSNNYHYTKTKKCIDSNINLIHIYEDDWVYRQDIVKSMILNKINKINNKIFARKCDIRIIDDINIVKNFLNTNHIQGYTTSTIKLGLFHNHELVSLMCFKKTKNDYELVRFCSLLNTSVVGGASKLLKYFIKNYDFNKIKTFSDRGYSNGGVYEKIGFNFSGNLKPSYYYVVDGIRIHKSNYKKKNLIKMGFNGDDSEHHIMIKRGIYRIYNSGYIRYEIERGD